MTALDADTLRDLRNLLAKWQDGQGDRRAITPSDYQQLITALVNAAPALLDAAEAVERIRTLADDLEAVKRVQIKRGFAGSPAAVLAGSHAKRIRAALAPPPDRNQP